jgi:hypothetical protein
VPLKVAITPKRISAPLVSRPLCNALYQEVLSSSEPLDTKRDREDITWIHLLKKLLIHH